VSEMSLRAPFPPIGLYLKSSGNKHSWGARQQRLVAVGERWGPEAVGLGQPTQGGPPADSRGPSAPQRSYSFMPVCSLRTFLEKMFKIFFQRILCSEIFFRVFVKREKG
jgi:hypothetical protein